MKLRIKGVDYSCKVTDFPVCDSINDEFILYNESTDKILVMNLTSSYIYKKIKASEKDKKNISDTEISDYLFNIFNVDETQKDEVTEDTRNILYHFINEGILTVSNDLPGQENLQY